MIKSYASRRPELRSVTGVERIRATRQVGCLDVLLHYLANTSSCSSLKTIDVAWRASRESSNTSFLSGLQNVSKLSLDFNRGRSSTLLEIARGLVQGGSPHLVDFTLYITLDTLTLAIEPDVIELADLTSRRPFSTVKNARICLGWNGDLDLTKTSGAQVLEFMARMWPVISRDAQVDLNIFLNLGEDLWEWSSKETDAKTGEIETGTSFWQGEGERAGKWLWDPPSPDDVTSSSEQSEEQSEQE
ncbi:uncharacterized protein BXZ73DRAFT_75774 [Epithele typhae]|uniref:uncharacterized protein n=1 Tax=Epithele typhae TaxID=378194 RepID=UPI0020080FA7|nr:uncharacterized protein BXZ73DRAFT_75774 [Epithele typhae]KAH9940177.1 hypothetical protein BXZ73DRAFT_75774 [Epithele typhae]